MMNSLALCVLASFCCPPVFGAPHLELVYNQGRYVQKVVGRSDESSFEMHAMGCPSAWSVSYHVPERQKSGMSESFDDQLFGTSEELVVERLRGSQRLRLKAPARRSGEVAHVTVNLVENVMW